MEVISAHLVMVVDDQRDTVDCVSLVLTKNGYSVVAASNGKECLKKLKTMKRKPELILLDLMMPKMSGFEVVEEIVKDEELRKISVAFLTASGIDAKTKERAEALGVKIYIEKPISADRLLRIVNHFVR